MDFTKNYSQSPLERLERVPRYLNCLSSLAGSACDLHIISGDDLALLLDLIVDEADDALRQLRTSTVQAAA